MDANNILVIMMFATFIGLLFTGFPIAFILAGVAMLFTFIGYLSDLYLGTFTGLDPSTVGMIINRIYNVMNNYVLVALPMFVYMGIMLDRSGLAENMMQSMQQLFGKVRGGLAISVTVIGILLAASTGIIGASVVLLGLLSLPVMVKQGYKRSFAAGTVCASGTLGILIPPSVMLVMMADQLALPVGDLFMGALLPGVILGTLYIIYILIYGLVRPNEVPLPAGVKKIDLNVIWVALKSMLPPFGLIVAVLGSIFAGIATITEASAVGALGATIIALINRKFNVKVFKAVIYDTFNTIAYIFAILIGANVFALVLRMLGGDELIEGALTGLPFSPIIIIVIILFVIFFLGFFLDWIEITFIVLPLLGPAVSALDITITGYGVVENPELVWFAILVAVCLQTSFLTPPVGYAIFYLKGVCPPEVTLLDIYRGIIPFVIIQLVGLIITLFWPNLVIWLPAVAYR